MPSFHLLESWKIKIKTRGKTKVPWQHLKLGGEEGKGGAGLGIHGDDGAGGSVADETEKVRGGGRIWVESMKDGQGEDDVGGIDGRVMDAGESEGASDGDEIDGEATSEREKEREGEKQKATHFGIKKYSIEWNIFLCHISHIMA